MTQSPDPDIRPALAALSGALAALDRPAMLIGGLAVIARGVPRLTIDIDAVAWRAVDRLDMTELIVRHHAEMDLQRMRRTVAGFYEVLEVPERLKEYDLLVSQALDEA